MKMQLFIIYIMLLVTLISCAKNSNYSSSSENNNKGNTSLIAQLDYTAVDTLDQFLNEMQRINNQGFSNYAIMIKNDFFYSNFSFDGNSNKTIYLKGDTGTRTITNNSDSPLFTIPKGITLVLGENISFNGNNKNTPVILVDGGRLEMLEGSSVYGANNSGVIVGTNNGSVFSGGVMIMNGGNIRNNKSEMGGGVFVNSRASFVLNKGTISGNTSSSQEFGGGGVFISPGGKFVMNGGTITGNSSNNNGGGVFVIISGLFLKNGGIIDAANKASNSGNIAFYYSQSSSGIKKRDIASDIKQKMDSTLPGSDGGWE